VLHVPSHGGGQPTAGLLELVLVCVGTYTRMASTPLPVLLVPHIHPGVLCTHGIPESLQGDKGRYRAKGKYPDKMFILIVMLFHRVDSLGP